MVVQHQFKKHKTTQPPPDVSDQVTPATPAVGTATQPPPDVSDQVTPATPAVDTATQPPPDVSDQVTPATPAVDTATQPPRFSLRLQIVTAGKKDEATSNIGRAIE